MEWIPDARKGFLISEIMPNIKDYIQWGHPKFSPKTAYTFKNNNQMIKDWFGVILNRNDKGVYFIDNIYIGKSKTIRTRLIKHCQNAINNRKELPLIESHILDCFTKCKTMDFEILSNNIEDENHFINLHFDNIINVQKY